MEGLAKQQAAETLTSAGDVVGAPMLHEHTHKPHNPYECECCNSVDAMAEANDILANILDGNANFEVPQAEVAPPQGQETRPNSYTAPEAAANVEHAAENIPHPADCECCNSQEALAEADDILAGILGGNEESGKQAAAESTSVQFSEARPDQKDAPETATIEHTAEKNIPHPADCECCNSQEALAEANDILADILGDTMASAETISTENDHANNTLEKAAVEKDTRPIIEAVEDQARQQADELVVAADQETAGIELSQAIRDEELRRSLQELEQTGEAAKEVDAQDYNVQQKAERAEADAVIKDEGRADPVIEQIAESLTQEPAANHIEATQLWSSDEVLETVPADDEHPVAAEATTETYTSVTNNAEVAVGDEPVHELPRLEKATQDSQQAATEQYEPQVSRSVEMDTQEAAGEGASILAEHEPATADALVTGFAVLANELMDEVRADIAESMADPTSELSAAQATHNTIVDTFEDGVAPPQQEAAATEFTQLVSDRVHDAFNVLLQDLDQVQPVRSAAEIHLNTNAEAVQESVLPALEQLLEFAGYEKHDIQRHIQRIVQLPLEQQVELIERMTKELEKARDYAKDIKHASPHVVSTKTYKSTLRKLASLLVWRVQADQTQLAEAA